ncbi:hypothetical protein BJQ89_01202 [Arthrobacter sp. ES1]|nr:hypothetical protein [Arthrobacter sp. ES1]
MGASINNKGRNAHSDSSVGMRSLVIGLFNDGLTNCWAVLGIAKRPIGSKVSPCPGSMTDSRCQKLGDCTV